MSEALRTALAKLVGAARPTPGETAAAFATVMDGQAGEAELAAWLTAIAMAGETADDIAEGAKALRARMTPLLYPAPTMDVCGTGGDGAHTLNISTAVSFVLAGCGLKVAKHGNRAMSSQSGAADVLAALGVSLDMTDAQHRAALDEAGVTFLFAQSRHPAMRHVGPVRRALGIRTIFNCLGPLANPAGAERQLIGVYHPRLAALMAEAAVTLGAEKAWVVHGFGGLDEVSTAGPTSVIEASPSGMRTFAVSPADAGLSSVPLDALRGGDAKHNARALMALLDGAPGAYRDAVILNAAAGLVVADRTASLREGAAIAAQAIDSRAAARALAGLVAAGQGQAT
jgi:anthranilate phosphoribosyltransferase